MILSISCSVMGCGGKTAEPTDPADVPESGDPAMGAEIDETGDEATPPETE